MDNRNRYALIERSTGETKIRCELNLDRPYALDARISSGNAFLDHMLNQVGRHGNFFLSIEADGDLEIDCHHTTEDIGIVLGEAFCEALGDKAGIRRYGHARVPLDEALADVVLDCSGRPYLYFDAEIPSPLLGSFETELVEEFFRAFAMHAKVTLHAESVRGQNSHHIIEALFKALARSLRDAVAHTPDSRDIPSTKGSL